MNKHYEQTLRELAIQLVTPERYGKVALTEVIEPPVAVAVAAPAAPVELPVINLGSLFD